MTSLRIKESHNLREVIDIIHDCWFELKAVQHNRITKTVSIGFVLEKREKSKTLKNYFLLRKIQIPYFESYLRISNVESLLLDDTENVESYDFNTLQFDPLLKKLSVKTGIPLRFEMTVSELDVSVQLTENIVKWRTVTTPFW